jgi:hypothetical protein
LELKHLITLAWSNTSFSNEISAQSLRPNVSIAGIPSKKTAELHCNYGIRRFSKQLPINLANDMEMIITGPTAKVHYGNGNLSDGVGLDSAAGVSYTRMICSGTSTLKLANAITKLAIAHRPPCSKTSLRRFQTLSRPSAQAKRAIERCDSSP